MRAPVRRGRAVGVGRFGMAIVTMVAMSPVTAPGGLGGSSVAPARVPPGAAAVFPLAPSTVPAQDVGEPATDPRARFQRGNELYQENDFTGALEAYRAVLRLGYEGADLYYNLGNAHFKAGNLGQAVLNYERALRLDPGDPDARVNLDLARSLTVDAIEPMPRFWVLSVLDWWVDLLPRSGLIVLTALAWLAVTGGLCLRILRGRRGPQHLAGWLMAGGGTGLLLLGLTLLARDGVLGGTDWGVILDQEVAVQSAPSPEDDLTLFHVHEGTKVRLDQRTEAWSEVVLEDGRVGWVPTGSLEEI